jgi:hypothetical protein
MASNTTFNHPVLNVFAMIRQIDDGVRQQVAECLPEGLNVRQYELLRLLDLSGEGQSPDQLAQRLHLPLSFVASTLQDLAAAGFARLDSAAGHGEQVWATEEGKEAYVAAVAAIKPKMERLREAFTLEEFREALPFLKALQTWFAERDWADRV